MSDIQRYRIQGAGYGRLDEDDEGDLCKYSDVEPLEGRIEELEKFIDGLAEDSDLSPLPDWRKGFSGVAQRERDAEEQDNE